MMAWLDLRLLRLLRLGGFFLARLDGQVMPHRTTCNGAQNGMVVRIVTCDRANDRALETSGTRRRRRGQSKRQNGTNRISFHLGLPFCACLTEMGTPGLRSRAPRRRPYPLPIRATLAGLAGNDSLLDTEASSTAETLPRVVIVGAGFGGLAAVRALRKAPVNVTIVDQHNYHLFQPLLYQIATASLSPAEIAQPIRSILRDQPNVRVILARVIAVDTRGMQVLTTDGGAVGYDYLILASGARHSYFGKDGWEANAPGIKTIDDATRLRANILLAFERAEVETDAEKRQTLLTFVVIGGGPTGVEMAGAIAELARNSIALDFRAIKPGSARIVLIEAGTRLLPTFPETLSHEARSVLERMGVEIRLGAPVTDIAENTVTIGVETISARTVIWAAGVRASAAGEWLKASVDHAGRVEVDADFSIAGLRGVYAIGDTAVFKAGQSEPLPGVAPAAKQAGAYVGALIATFTTHRPPPKPFAYADYGNLATIGRKNAVADFGRIRIRGFAGWLLWSVAHIYFLIGLRNRFVVALSWAWSYVTYQRGARLITGTDA
jgi:NADH dehydrogenase